MSLDGELTLEIISGCTVYYNRFLASSGIPIVFECTGDYNLNSPLDFRIVAENASRTLSTLLGLDLNIHSLRHWEYIGRRFNLYAFDLAAKGYVLGQIRVVETGGLLVNVTGVLSEFSGSLIPPSVWDSLISGSRLSIGYNMGIYYLKGSSPSWPRGQKPISNYVIYGIEGLLSIDPKTWSLRISGLVARELNLSLEDLMSRSIEIHDRDFHCVTGWSIKGNMWLGVRIRDLAEEAGLSSRAKWLLASSLGGYSTVIPLDEALREDSIIAIGLNSKPLTRENGYPARIIIPRLYGWKSAKWLKELVFLEEYVDGYWEALAYHERGLVEAEERFKIRNPRIAEKGELPENSTLIKPE
ncbi:MAG: molybdopterin-dependent oxidoreductase [Acidilobaceae archaeon]